MEYNISTVLEGNFYGQNPKKNLSYNVKLNEKQLIIVRSNGSLMKTKVVYLDDVVGCRCTRRRKRVAEKCECHPNNTNVFSFLDNDVETNDISAYLHIYTYVLKDNVITSGQKRERFTITLRFRLFAKYEDNLKEAFKWKRIIRELLTKAQPGGLLSRSLDSITDKYNAQAEKILIILNPKSGPGKAKEIFHEQVVPLLTEAEVDYDLHITRARNDARMLIKTGDILKWKKGIVVIGGDGVLYEVINGIMERSDWKHILNTIPLGVIPGGSGNGLAKSLSHLTGEPYDANPVLISTLNILKGIIVPVDLVRVETSTEVTFSFLSCGWGMIADIDIESERLRMLGSTRFTVYTLARIIGLRTYSGRLSFLRASVESETDAHSENKIEIQIQDFSTIDEDMPNRKDATFDVNSNFSFDMDSISLDTGCNPGDNEKIRRADSFYSISSHKSAYLSVGKMSSYLSLPEISKNSKKLIYGPGTQLPPLNKPVPNSWEVYQGDFVLVHATYQSHLSGDAFLAPSCKPNDGIIWLFVIRAGITRVNLLQCLLAMQSGNHLNIPFVEMIPVQAFRLEPFTEGSYLVVDGEVLEHSSVIQAEVCPGLLSMFSRQRVNEK